jgi:hypothetical protein
MEARNGQYEHRAGNAVPLFRTTSCAAYGMATPDAFPSLRRQPEQKPEPQTSVGDDPEADATRPQQALCARIDAAEPGDWRELRRALAGSTALGKLLEPMAFGGSRSA